MKKETKYYEKPIKQKKRNLYQHRSFLFMMLLGFIALGLIVGGLCRAYFIPYVLNRLSVIGINNILNTNEENYEYEVVTEELDWNLILVNKWNYIPDDYEVELMELTNGQLIDKRIYPALQSMFDSARSEGIYPIVASGYRTTEKQQSLLDEKIAEYLSKGYTEEEAKNKAEIWVAIPGTSEHQLGLGVDINADGVHSMGNEVYKWLKENSYKFGFINRYPEDKTEITGIINEPWHYRYVGIEAASEIHKNGICLEEYINSQFEGNETERVQNE